MCQQIAVSGLAQYSYWILDSSSSSLRPAPGLLSRYSFFWMLATVQYSVLMLRHHACLGCGLVPVDRGTWTKPRRRCRSLPPHQGAVGGDSCRCTRTLKVRDNMSRRILFQTIALFPSPTALLFNISEVIPGCVCPSNDLNQNSTCSATPRAEVDPNLFRWRAPMGLLRRVTACRV